MIAVIRISGMIKLKKPTVETLDRLRLRRKYVCVLIDDKNAEVMGMIKKLRDFVAYGDINQETLTKLIKARGQWDKTAPKGVPSKKGKISDADASAIAKESLTGKKLKDSGLKPFFRLHPPRGGIDSKEHYPKGVLGNHKEDINKLIARML